MGMACVHFECLLTRLQEETHEEDVRFRNLVKEAAILIIQSGYLSDETTIDPQKPPDDLHEGVPGLKEKIVHMARSFRSVAATDIAADFQENLKKVLGLVLKAVVDGNTSVITAHNDAKLLIEYYPDCSEELYRWTKLSVGSRCQKSDFHHFRLRGQWQVRDALEKVAAGQGLDFMRMMETSSLGALGGHIAKVRKKPSWPRSWVNFRLF